MTNVESSTSHGKFCRDSGTVRRVHPVLDDQSRTGGNVCGLREHRGSHSQVQTDVRIHGELPQPGAQWRKHTGPEVYLA